MKNISRKLFWVLLLVGSAIYLMMVTYFSEEAQIKNALLMAWSNTSKEKKTVDLNNFLSRKISKICIQTPYLTRELMEERVGSRVEGFSQVNDEYFVLWVFSSDGPPVQVEFNRWEELNFVEGGSHSCVQSSSVYLINKQLTTNLENVNGVGKT